MITSWLVAVVSALAGVVVIALWVDSMFVSLLPAPAPSWVKRNRAVLTTPSIGIDLLLLAPIVLLSPGSGPQVLLLLPFLFFALLGLIGLLPFPLPRWMYPAWREARRRQIYHWLTEAATTKENLQEEATSAGSGLMGASSSPPATTPGPGDTPWPPPQWRRVRKEARKARKAHRSQNKAGTTPGPPSYPDPADIPWPPPHWRREHRNAHRARRPQEEKDQTLTERIGWAVSMAVGIPGIIVVMILGYIAGLLLEVLLGWEDTSLPVIASVIACVPGSLISVAAGDYLGRRLARTLITARNRLRDQPPRP